MRRVRTAWAGIVFGLLAAWPSAARADWFCSPTEQWRQPISRLFSAHDVGYGELVTQVGWHHLVGRRHWQDLTLGVLLRKGTVGSHGTVQLTLSYRPPWQFTSLTLYAQAFFGYNETLLHYNERTSVFRFGIALDDRFSWLTGEPGSVARPPPPP